MGFGEEVLAEKSGVSHRALCGEAWPIYHILVDHTGVRDPRKHQLF